MDKWLPLQFYNGCKYLSMLGFNLIHVNKRDSRVVFYQAMILQLWCSCHHLSLDWFIILTHYLPWLSNRSKYRQQKHVRNSLKTHKCDTKLYITLMVVIIQQPKHRNNTINTLTHTHIIDKLLIGSTIEAMSRYSKNGSSSIYTDNFDTIFQFSTITALIQQRKRNNLKVHTVLTQ